MSAVTNHRFEMQVENIRKLIGSDKEEARAKSTSDDTIGNKVQQVVEKLLKQGLITAEEASDYVDKSKTNYSIDGMVHRLIDQNHSSWLNLLAEASEPDDRLNLQLLTACTFAEKNQLRSAIKVALFIKSENGLSLVLCGVIEVTSERRRNSLLDPLVLSVAKLIPHPDYRNQALKKVILRLLNEDRMDEAISCFKEMHEDIHGGYFYSVLEKLVKHLLYDKKIDELNTLIEEANSQKAILCIQGAIVSTYLDKGAIDNAMVIALGIDDEVGRSNALEGIIDKLLEIGDLIRAEEYTKLIPELNTRIECIGSVVGRLSRDGKMDEAERLAMQIPRFEIYSEETFAYVGRRDIVFRDFVSKLLIAQENKTFPSHTTAGFVVQERSKHLPRIERLLAEIHHDHFKDHLVVRLVKEYLTLHDFRVTNNHYLDKAKKVALNLSPVKRHIALKPIVEHLCNHHRNNEAIELLKEKITQEGQNALLTTIFSKLTFCDPFNIDYNKIFNLPDLDLSCFLDWTSDEASLDEIENAIFAGARFSEERLTKYYQNKGYEGRERINKALAIQAQALKEMTETKMKLREVLSSFPKELTSLIADYHPVCNWKVLSAKCQAIKEAQK